MAEEKEAVSEEGSVPSGMFGKPTTYDPGAALRQWVEKQSKDEAEIPPAPPLPKSATPADVQEQAKAEPAKPTDSAAATIKALAAKIAGEDKPKAEAAKDAPKDKAPAPWDENATAALRKLGMRDDELPKLQALAAENPWLMGFVDGAQKRITKSDADFAALKAGTREPTPSVQRPLTQESGDQPGSGQVADLFGKLTEKLGEELGDENATLLRQAFGVLEAQNSQLREELHGYTRSVQAERQAAEIEVLVQQSRSALREEFPWMDDEKRFEQVASEMAGMRPESMTPEAVRDTMRKAARVVFYDDVRADAAAVVSKLDNQRKDQAMVTRPNGVLIHDDSPPLTDFEEFRETMKMNDVGMPQSEIQRFVLANREKRLRVQHKK